MNPRPLAKPPTRTFCRKSGRGRPFLISADSTSPPQMGNSREPLKMIDCIELSKLHAASDANVGRRGTIRIPGVETANFLGRILQVLGGFPRTVVGAISDPADKVFQLVPKYLGV